MRDEPPKFPKWGLLTIIRKRIYFLWEKDYLKLRTSPGRGDSMVEELFNVKRMKPRRGDTLIEMEFLLIVFS
jgi:hypothetical protein